MEVVSKVNARLFLHAITQPASKAVASEIMLATE